MLVSSTVLAQTPAKTAPEQGPPPKNLSQRADGHFSANQDPSNPDQYEVHVVQAGETLSMIAGQVLKDSRLWPQLWEQNEHIINPHWIYPNDKILIRPITLITEVPRAAPEPQPPAAPEPAPPAPAAVQRPPAAPAPAAAPVPAAEVFSLGQQKPVPEVKIDDLYCSGFVRKAAVPKDLKVISKFDAAGALSGEGDYIYIGQGSEDGVQAGNMYQVIRPTTKITNPQGRTSVERDLGTHYLEVGQIRVVLTQPDFSLARVAHSCGDAIEVGDVMLPFEPAAFPAPPRPRPFSPFITTNSGIKGSIVSTKGVLLNYGSSFKMSGAEPGVLGSAISSMNRGIASEGTIVYISAGQENGVKPGDLFIVYRGVESDKRLYSAPREAGKLKEFRTAIGELLVVKTGERAATALVTYASDALALGDSVERR